MDTKNFRISRRVFAGGALTALVGGRAVLAAQEMPGLKMPGMKMTASSDLGPFYPVRRDFEDDADMTRLHGHAKRAIGDVIEVSGRVLDRYGNPVSNARLEIWQANSAGRYAHANDTSDNPLDPDFQGYANLRTGADGEWRITTIRPGAYGPRTRHIHFDIQGRDQRLPAQMYFPEETEANAKDGLYRQLRGDADTCLARLTDKDKYRWDIVMMDG